MTSLYDALRADTYGPRDTILNRNVFSGGLDRHPNAQRAGDFLRKLDPPDPGRSNLGLFAESMWSAAVPEMFGSPPSRDTDRFRMEHPAAGMLSVVAGMAPFFITPALGPAKLLSAGIPGFTKALQAADKLALGGSLFKAGLVREATVFAPLEGIRVVGSALNPEEGSFGRTVKSAGTELAVLGGLGGVLGTLGPKLRHYSASRLKTANPEVMEARELAVAQHIGEQFNRSGPAQYKWEFLTAWRNQPKPPGAQSGGLTAVEEHIDWLLPFYESEIKTGLAPLNPGKNTTRHVAFMGNSTRTKRIESLYEHGKNKAKGAKGILAKLIGRVNGEGETQGWLTGALADSSVAAWEQVTKMAGVSKDWMGFTQFPRELLSSTAQAKVRLLQILHEDFTKVGANQWIAKEAPEGLTIGIRRLPDTGMRGTKKIQGTFLDKAKSRVDPTAGRYFIFKTNRPSKWFKGASEVSDTNASVYNQLGSKWGRAAVVPDADVPVLLGMENEAPFFDANLQSLFTGKTRFSPDPNISAEVGYLRMRMESFMPQSVKPAFSAGVDFTNQMGNALRKVAAPARLQAAQNPRLHSLIMWAKKTFTEAHQRGITTIKGELKPEFMEGADAPIKAIFKTAFDTSSRRTGGTEALIKKRLFTQEAHKDFIRIWEEGMNVDAAKLANLHPEAVTLRQELGVIDDFYTKQIAQQARALGVEESFIPSSWHFGIARTWRGTLRAPIRDADTREILGFGSGFTKQQAADDANAIAAIINKEEGRKAILVYGDARAEGVDLVIKDNVWHSGSKEVEQALAARMERAKMLAERQKATGLDESLGLPTDISPTQADIYGFATMIHRGNPMVDRVMRTRNEILRNTPDRFKKSQKMIGAIGTRNRPMSVDEIISNHSAGIMETERYLAREAFAEGPPRAQLEKLTLENSADAVTFNRIFNSYNGVSGPLAKVLEKGVDAVMSDLVGPGMATKMVRGANTAMFTLTLGAGDVGFAALNLITPIQTAWPEVSQLLTAPIETLQKYYSSALVKVPSGGFRTVRFMDTWRFAKVAMGEVWRPDAEGRAALQWAFEKGAVGRDFVEAVHGPLRALSEGKGGIWDNLQRASEFPVVASEEASRAYSFMLGRRVAKDFFRMSEGEARVFGEQFVNNTMYGYTAGDRPRMLTGALGAGWGLFKNWTSNYTGNLGRYTAEASRGNFTPLMWAMGSTGAVGGLAALPAAGMADGFSRFFADKPLSDLVYDWVGNDPGDDSKPWTADMMMHGIFSLAGFTLRSRASVPSSHLATDITMYANISILDRAGAALQGLGTAIEDSMDLKVPLNNPKFRREMLQAFAPRTLQRAMTTFGEQGVTSLRTGNSLLPALNLYEGTLRSVGLTPIQVANAFEVHQNKIYDAKEKREAIQKLGRRWADAEMNRDWHEIGSIINDAIWQYSIPIDSVQRSADARIRKMMYPLSERQFNDAQDRKRMQMRGINR
jgi:hypothetical protein